MVGEVLEGTGGGVDWDSLRNVEMSERVTPVEAEEEREQGKDVAREVGGKALDAMAAPSRVEAQEAENTRLGLMRQKWGDFESSRELFGEKTEMAPYEYWIIAENMPWDEFTDFCEEASELGKRSELEYQDMVFNKASELCGKGLCLPKSFEIAVRRYNTVKQFGEKRPERFYTTMNLKRAVDDFTFRNNGWLMGEDGAEDEGNGENPRRLHLDYDGEEGWSGVGAGAEMMTVVLDGAVIDDDDFDPVGGRPAMDRVRKEKVLVVLGADEMVTDMMRMARNEKGHYFDDSYDVMSVAQWENGGEPVETVKERKRRRERFHEAVFRPDKREVREFVDGFLEKVDDEELERLTGIYKQDSMQGMEAAVRYFAGVLGTREPKVVWDEEEKRGSGRRTAVGGELKFSAKDKKAKPEVMLSAVAHEMFHEFQSGLEEAWAKGKLEPGTLEEQQARLLYFNRANYQVSEGVGGCLFYGDQIEEAQAYHFGDTVKKRMKRLKRRRA